ncbi:universal stress protein [Streptomyces caeni]|uniref:Universal stress protein n=1 Tax=Streptomyces caeni TaxID=2307231 RepID=A0ABW4IPP6_9ACTN
MTPTVTVGLDGSPESLAAVDWAAREALRRSATLRLVHAGDQQPYGYVPFAGEAVPPPDADRSASMLREVRASVTSRHPGLRVIADRVAGQPAAALLAAAGEAELLVLGSRGPGRAAGALLGSVALAVVARAERPVVLVRAGTDAADEHLSAPVGPATAGPYRDVVLGLDQHDPDDAVLRFAFDAASLRDAALRVVHGLKPADGLRPWREKFPDVETTEQVVIGTPGSHLADVSHDASLVVVGRKSRPSPVGPHIGPVTHAVLHHAAAPVAVVPHG